MSKKELSSLLDLIPEIKQGKLGSRPSWDEGYMCDAIRASSRASCLNVRSGSVLIYNKRIVSTGYNGAPQGVPSCIELRGCFKKSQTGKEYEETMNMGMCQGVHSEVNSLNNLRFNPPEKSINLYTTVFPCNTCAKILTGRGIINQIVFKRLYDEREFKQTMRIFNEASISIKRLDLSPERYIDIIFNQRKVKFDAWSDEQRGWVKDKLD